MQKNLKDMILKRFVCTSFQTDYIVFQSVAKWITKNGLSQSIDNFILSDTI